MRKNLLIIVAVITLTFGLSTVSFAQLGGIINRAKDAANKKKDKEKKKTEEAKTNDSSNQSSPNSSPTPTNSTTSTVSAPVQNQIGTIYFANQPFPADGSVTGAKTSFNSNEFIYGRIVFKSGTLRENMKIFSKQEAELIDKNDPPTYQSDALAKRVPFMFYKFLIFKDGRRIFEAMLDRVGLNEGDLDKNYWDFDVLPAPDKAKTTWTAFNTPQPANIYKMISPENFREEGKYEIKFSIYNPTKTAWSKIETDREKWIYVNGDLAFNFRATDVATLQANGENAEKNFERNTANAAFENQSSPKEWLLKSNALIAGVTLAQLQTLFKNHYSNANEISVLKIYANPASSSALWSVQKNEYGIPLYRYSNQWFMGFGKNRVTGKCFFKEFGLRQNYAGGGTYGGTFVDYSDNGFSLKCEKLGVK
jgi:Sec-independent protein translocase protein TatA